MKPELEQKLYDKYPKLFVQKDLSSMDTRMCDGICTPDSWWDIIAELCGRLTKLDMGLEATQVKDKQGYLRFYLDETPECAKPALKDAERKVRQLTLTETKDRLCDRVISSIKIRSLERDESLRLAVKKALLAGDFVTYTYSPTGKIIDTVYTPGEGLIQANARIRELEDKIVELETQMGISQELVDIDQFEKLLQEGLDIVEQNRKPYKVPSNIFLGM